VRYECEHEQQAEKNHDNVNDTSGRRVLEVDVQPASEVFPAHARLKILYPRDGLQKSQTPFCTIFVDQSGIRNPFLRHYAVAATGAVLAATDRALASKPIDLAREAGVQGQLRLLESSWQLCNR
jgi:hypothetical protein